MIRRVKTSEFIFLIVLLVIAAILIFGSMVLTVYADGFYEKPEEYIRMEATAYCYGTTRCDGKPVRTGVCAGKPEWYGNVAAIYLDDGGKPGEFIGYFECLDTGGERIKTGEVIDIYMPNKDDCIKFGRRKVLVSLMDGEG